MIYQHLFLALPEPDYSQYIPLYFSDNKIGCIPRQYASLFNEFSRVFQFVFGNVSATFSEEFVESSVEERSEKLVEVSSFFRDQGVVFNWRDELFTIYEDKTRTKELFRVERGVVPLMGLQAHGIHVNGYSIVNGEPEIWIARRSITRKVAPLKYDQLVAGGLPSELSLMDNVAKEAEEEAGINSDIIKRVDFSGTIQYQTNTEDLLGIRNDILHCYDLELPPDFCPCNQDGEVEGFMRISVAEVCKILQQTDQFKSNTALVMLSFLMRHHWLEVNDTECLWLEDKFLSMRS